MSSEHVECNGFIIEEECTFHKQVDWNVNYVRSHPEELERLTSPEFKIGSQHYKLELSEESSDWANLVLYRKGPSANGPFRYVPYCAGLQRANGTYDEMNLKGELDLKNECETWTQIRLQRISLYELEPPIRVPDYSFVVFFRLNLEQPLATAQECTHGAAKMSAVGTGKIREEKCFTHKHVEWDILPDMLREKKNLITPTFMIGTRSYKLELCFGNDKLLCIEPKTAHIHLYSNDPPVAGNRWWAGLILSNEKFVGRSNGRGTLDLKKEGEIWTQKNLFTVKDAPMRLDIPPSWNCHLVVFFRLCFEQNFAVSEICGHVPASTLRNNFTRTNGTVREKSCSSYKHMEWETPIERSIISLMFSHEVLLSPEFVIGYHLHRLELCFDFPNLELNLHSRGLTSGISGNVRWWAGFRRSDETSILGNISGKMHLQELCELWTQKCIYSICLAGNEEKLKEIRGNLVIFFRVYLCDPQLDTKTYTDDNKEISDSQVKGSIQEIECASHKQVEWIVIPESPDDKGLDLWAWSPTFAVGKQQFKFHVSYQPLVSDIEARKKTLGEDMPREPLRKVCLRLYTKGPSVGGPCRYLRWCAGLQRRDGTYQHKILRGELDLKESWELWTPIAFVNFSECAVSAFTFYLRWQKETALTVPKTCIHDAAEKLALGFGKIRRQEFTSYEQVEWTTDYGELKKKLWNYSPEFLIENQHYILELSQDSNASDSMTLSLYRRGSSISEPSRFARWWAGVKRSNGTYHHKNHSGELDLNEECQLWTPIYLHRICRYKLERELLAPAYTLTVFFRLSVEQTKELSTHDGEESLQKIKRPISEDNSDVIFRVKGVEFKTPKAIFEVRVPVFKAMFHHDTVESATGVVTIEDIEPIIFEEFIHYVSTGFVRILTVDNARDLYLVADKYLVDDLKAECLQCISETISIDNFCDVAALALRHREDDLLKDVTDFLSRNKNIATTDSWVQFYSHNPTEASDLLFKSFLRQERTESNLLRYVSDYSSSHQMNESN